MADASDCCLIPEEDCHELCGDILKSIETYHLSVGGGVAVVDDNANVCENLIWADEVEAAEVTSDWRKALAIMKVQYGRGDGSCYFPVALGMFNKALGVVLEDFANNSRLEYVSLVMA